jgi:hypothetical protein
MPTWFTSGWSLPIPHSLFGRYMIGASTCHTRYFMAETVF